MPASGSKQNFDLKIQVVLSNAPKTIKGGRKNKTPQEDETVKD